MDRRKFLRNSGLAFGTAVVAPQSLVNANETSSAAFKAVSGDVWAKVRADFILDHSNIQMAQMLLASHPRPVMEAIARQNIAFDLNPAIHWEEKWIEAEQVVADAAARYLECEPGEIALTDSTTQGVSLLMNGFKLKPGDEVLSTTHDHYITDMSINYACEKRGASWKRVEEFADPAKATVDEVVGKITAAITHQTRLVMVTWVQSCTGVKMPIRAIADAIAELNKARAEENRIYFAVDGVHGFGNQAEAVSSLGCDFFAAGTHKWIFGPRGTGILYGKRSAWHMVEPTIPAFRNYPYFKWMGEEPEEEASFYEMMSPGGFHAFSHRWSLNVAFDYQMELGRENVHARTTELNTMLKEEMVKMNHVHLHTPVDPNLSAGINCFEVEGFGPVEAVHYFHDKGVIASNSPYKVSYARLTPCVINTEEEVQQCIDILRDMRA